MKCSKCEKEIKDTAKFCKYCGTKTGASKDKKTFNWSWLMSGYGGVAIILVFAVLLGSMIAVFGGKSGKDGKMAAKNNSKAAKKRPFSYGRCRIQKPAIKESAENLIVEIVDFKGQMEMPTDISVSSDGKTIFVADGKKRSVMVFERETSKQFVLKKEFKPVTSGVPLNKNEFMYIDVDEKEGKLYLVDCVYEALSSYNLDGGKAKILAQGGHFSSVRSMRLTHEGLLACAVPPKNSIVFYDKAGNESRTFFPEDMDDCDNLKQPCFAAESEDGITAVMDAENRRVMMYEKNMKLKDAIAATRASTILGPQIVFFEKAKKPFFAVTLEQAVYFMTMDGKKGIKFDPSAKANNRDLVTVTIMDRDSEGNLYVVSPWSKMVARIIIEKDLF